MDTTKIEQWMIALGLDITIPPAYEIWSKSDRAYKNGDKSLARLYQNMNLVLHNSSIPSTVKVGTKVNFAYGGIGLIIHFNSIIEDYATIGSNVTLGAGGGLTSTLYFEGRNQNDCP